MLGLIQIILIKLLLDLERLCTNAIDMEIKFDYEYIEKQEDVRKHIRECEGKHVQQAIYSTFHDGLTQICFGCKKVRSTILITR